jgi:hypothetical protein
LFWRKKKSVSELLLQAECDAPIPKSPKPPHPSNMTEDEKRAHWLETRGEHPKSEEDRKAAYEMEQRFDEAAKAYFDSYDYPEPEYKIVQEEAGHFVIKRRMSRVAKTLYKGREYCGTYHFWPRDLSYWADELEPMIADKENLKPEVWFESVKNTDSPIHVYKRDSYGYGSFYRDNSRYVLDGYADLAFNVFQDAEDYLRRMVEKPEIREVGYDFPPLTCRQAENES